MKEKEQSSIEWLIEQIVNRQNGESNSKSLDEIFIESKQLHKKEIIEAYHKGELAIVEVVPELAQHIYDLENDTEDAEQYYNEKYSTE